MKKIIVVVMLALQTICGFSKDSTLTAEELSAVKFEQNLEAQVPLDLVFYEKEKGKIPFADLLGEKPALLVLGYDDCPMLCGLVLNGMVSTLQELKLRAGKDFSLISVSIDPLGDPEVSAERKAMYLKRYGRRAAAEGWHFLTGEERSIDELAEAVGFGYLYDSGTKEYAHPSGFIVLTPSGRISSYFFGVDFRADELNAAIREASNEKVGSPVRQFLLTCFQYNPLTGKYGSVTMKILRIGSLLILGIGGFYIVRSLIREKKGDSP